MKYKQMRKIVKKLPQQVWKDRRDTIKGYCSCSKEELEQLLKNYDPDHIYIIGGGQVYREYLEQCDTVYVTHIEAGYEADTWFPDLEADERFIMEETLFTGEWKGVGYRICRWKNTAVRTPESRQVNLRKQR